jgi:hypothetical protein
MRWRQVEEEPRPWWVYVPASISGWGMGKEFLAKMVVDVGGYMVRWVWRAAGTSPTKNRVREREQVGCVKWGNMRGSKTGSVARVRHTARLPHPERWALRKSRVCNLWCWNAGAG